MKNEVIPQASGYPYRFVVYSSSLGWLLDAILIKRALGWGCFENPTINNPHFVLVPLEAAEDGFQSKSIQQPTKWTRMVGMQSRTVAIHR